jgi:acetolactate synthase-1/2/3 large subunit
MKKRASGVTLLGRRRFLKSAAAGGTATLAATAGAIATLGADVNAGAPQAAPAAQQRSAPVPGAEVDPPADVEILTVDRPGSDFMVDVIKALGFEYVAANPGSSFRGLHESLVNYGGNKAPEFITCCHEESSVGMAHGYAAVEGKPMLVLAHSTVGLQHASMAIYNAYAGGVPVFIMLGNTLDATQRRPGAEWYHSVVDATAMVRDFIKWDDLPVSLPHFAESAMRAYKIAMTPPRLPVILVADSDLQERSMGTEHLRLPRLTVEQPPQGDSGSIAEAARLLVGAVNPVIVAGDATRSEEGMAKLVELAELLQAQVVDQGGNFPSHHPLNQRGRLREADVILGLEEEGFWATVNSMRDQPNRPSSRTIPKDAKLISISARSLYNKGNYQNLQRYQEVELAMAADPETSIPPLIEAVRKLITASHKSAFADRGKKLAAEQQRSFERQREAATYAWDSSPISVQRLLAELWAQIKNDDWALAGERGGPGGGGFLWRFDKRYQRLQGGNAVGIGFTAPSSVGAALAHRKHGRLSVCFQTDGDLMYAPGILWTAAHHRIPLLSVVHNNRAYHQEVMHVQRMANRRQRDVTTAQDGTTLWDPFIDYAKLAQGMGVYAEGPISNPKDLGAALQRAVAVVKRGEPALVDVVTQPR